jgi:hypothetical protein
MKKVLSFAAVAAITIFVASCGDGGAAEAKRKADSARVADSLAAIQMAWKQDSAHSADSVKAAADAAMAKMKADSAHMADSMAKAKGGKPMKPADKVKAEDKKAVHGRG